MSKRNRREHGRILSVETMQRGSALDVDAAAGATSITVVDGGDFDEDGGWLYIGAQVIEFTECDDDTGVLTLADPLTAAAEQGDPVAVYDPLYGEVVDFQVAVVQLDGEYDNPDPVEAEVAEGVGDLPEGDRGRAGESCTLLRVADDEWEIVGVGGRSRKSRGLRAEWDDTYVLTADDITAGTATVPLTHRPVDEWLIAVLAGVPQRPSNYTLNYDAQTITWPLSGWEKAGDRIWVHYAYRKGIVTPIVQPAEWEIVLVDTINLAQPGLGPGGTQLVGVAPQWKDDTSATYAEITGNYSGPGEPQFAGGTSCDVLSPTAAIPTDAGSVEVVARLQISTPDAAASLPYPRVGLAPQSGHSGATLNASPTTLTPADPTWVEIVLAGDPTALLANPGTYVLFVNAPFYAAGTAPVASGLRVRVHEARVFVREVA